MVFRVEREGWKRDKHFMTDINAISLYFVPFKSLLRGVKSIETCSLCHRHNFIYMLVSMSLNYLTNDLSDCSHFPAHLMSRPLISCFVNIISPHLRIACNFSSVNKCLNIRSSCIQFGFTRMLRLSTGQPSPLSLRSSSFLASLASLACLPVCL